MKYKLIILILAFHSYRATRIVGTFTHQFTLAIVPTVTKMYGIYSK